jgi:hypothetical protein
MYQIIIAIIAMKATRRTQKEMLAYLIDNNIPTLSGRQWNALMLANTIRIMFSPTHRPTSTLYKQTQLLLKEQA